MATICPCITATDPHEYREQIERVEGFAQRLHIDFMDGQFAPTESPPIESAWWPVTVAADLHIMYARPQDYIKKVLSLKPNLVIVHAEAEGHLAGMAEVLHASGIKFGVGLLPKTSTAIVRDTIKHIDHVLVFSGDLGHFGGVADTSLITKITQLKRMKKTLEIGWDGGINDNNVVQLAKAGVDVLNAGGFIQKASVPAAAYATLEALAGKQT